MSRKFDATHERIIQAARKHFLENGYPKASLRDLCKEADVTTGAFYRHFKSKAELFALIVSPAVNLYFEGYNELEKEYSVQNITLENARSVILGFSLRLRNHILKCLYKYFDEYKLLIYKSQGTEFESFSHDVWKLEKNRIQSLMNQLINLGAKLRPMAEEEIHMITASMYQGLNEIILNNYPLDESINYVSSLFDFFVLGWASFAITPIDEAKLPTLSDFEDK